MGLRRHFVKGLLKKYVQGLQDRHIHVDVSKGYVRIDDATLELAPLAELLEGVLPAGWEVTLARAQEVQLHIPWKKLKQQSTIVTVGSLVLTVRQHDCGAGGDEEYWRAALARRRQAAYESFVAAKKGGGPPEQPSVAQAIADGLRLQLERLDLTLLRKDGSQCPGDNGAERGPLAALALADLSWGFAESGGSNRSLRAATRQLAIGAVSLGVELQGRVERFLHPAQLQCTLRKFAPVACPFPLTQSVDLDLEAVCLDGHAEQLKSVVEVIADLVDAEELLSKRMGPSIWSDAQHEALSPLPEKAGSGASIASSKESATPKALSGAEQPENGKSKKKHGLSRFLPGHKRRGDKAVAQAAASQAAAREAEVVEEAESEDSDGTAADCDRFSEAGLAAALGADLSDLGSVPESLDCAPEPPPEIAAAVRVAPGAARQSNFTLQLSALRAGITLPGLATVELTASGLGFRREQCSWLTEAQQGCAARLGGRYAHVLELPPAERGSTSADGVVSGQQQLSLRALRLLRVHEPGEDGGRRTQPLVEARDAKEEMLVAVWRTGSGPPHVACREQELKVVPLEVVVRSVKLLYEPDVFKGLGEIFRRFAQDEGSGQAGDGAASDGKEKEGCSNGCASHAASPPRAMTVVLKDAIVQQKAALEGGLAHQATIQSLVFEHLSPDFRELTSAFGLAKSEVGGGGGGGFPGLDVEDMDLEQLRAEVQMWRMRCAS